VPEFTVQLFVRPPDSVTAEQVAFEMAVEGPKFAVEVEGREDGLILFRCSNVKASGVAAMPEAMRVAQSGLSAALKHSIPAYADHGGLLWKDVWRAEAIAHS
jgi:hypothetical protein